MADASVAVRHFRKYPNRRLYDTGESRYVTLADVCALVRAGVPVKVHRVLSRRERLAGAPPEDITRETLLGIICAQETARPRVDLDALRSAIILGAPL